MLAQNLAFVNDSYTSQSSVGTLGTSLTSGGKLTSNSSDNDNIPVNERTTPAPSTEQLGDLNRSRNSATQAATGVTNILNKDYTESRRPANSTPTRQSYGTNAN